MVESLANFYVNYVEDGLKILLFFIAVIFVLYLINVARDSKKKMDLVNAAFSFIIKVIKEVVMLMGRSILWMARISIQIITVIFASIRDFFTSKI